ncbi:COP9 signalosome complex subunit 3 [Patella vulgata]|uniref:COP9 signalosome complex subunit 3 n=1 Tax=Patella vulgata TaxID=6465 RepID=UPI0021804B47|nr:COP9 signalosome complex subunit 3 [Patella vulgata]
MSSTLEQYVNTVQNYSTQGNFAQLCEFITKSADALTKHIHHLDYVMGTLNVQQHSLGILGILCVKFNMPNIHDFEMLFHQTQEFIYMCNGEQVRYATESFADLSHKFTHQLIERKTPLRGIAILSKAIRKIQLFPSQLTSLHSDLCQLCLLSKNMKPALEFLEVDITDISKEGGQYDAKDFLQYYYYGGMIYTALKKYDRSLYFFEIAITTPSMAVSHIMMEAYKKFILVALILHGKIPLLPKYTSQVVIRYIKPLCQLYHDLSNAYCGNRSNDLRAIVTKHTETINRDKNMGLVKQCINSLFKKNIQRLTKTFLTLSLADMANRVHLSGAKEAEKYVLHMIEDGEIYATINQKDGMVRFHDNPEEYNNATMLRHIDEEMQKCMKLDNKLKEMDREITVNPQYVQKSSGTHDDDLPVSSTKVQGY